MREVSQKLRTPNGLNDMEREPAYKRKNIQITDMQQPRYGQQVVDKILPF